MASLNKATLIGNLGRDPEMKYLASGDAVTNFSIATTETWKDKTSGEKKEAVEWHNISAFGKLAEICGQYLKKGSQVYIEGKIQTRKYDKDGVTHYATSIKADNLIMLGGKPDGDRPAAASKPTASAASFDDDQIPF